MASAGDVELETKPYPAVHTEDHAEDDDQELLKTNATDHEEIEIDSQGLQQVRERTDSLTGENAVDIWQWDNCGYLLQYYAVGIIYGGLPGTIYGFFLAYLNVPPHVYATAGVITTLPWSFKFLFGLINDTRPIRGLHRKPYMVFGWTLCAIALLFLSVMGMPEPYFCKDASGHFISKVEQSDGSFVEAEPCNANAPMEGGKYARVMMVAALGYVIADVAADGLTVQYARREPVEVRGQTQTTIYLIRSFGSMTATLLIAFGMNGPDYNLHGGFAAGLSFNNIMLILTIPAIAMVPLSWWRVVEPPDEEAESIVISEYLGEMWQLLSSRAMFFVVIYSFWNPVIQYISTTAGGLVKIQWAGVENLQNQLFSLFGQALFAIGLYLVKTYFLHYSWRCMLIVTTVFLNMLDMCFVYPTIYDLVRDQYFYLGESVLYEIPAAANFVVGTFYIVEMADDGNEGLVYGLLTTIGNLGSPVAQAISNQVFAQFTPSLDDSANYVADTPQFRNTVAESFTLSYGFAFLSIAFVWFLPWQKEEAQRRKREWGKNPLYAWITVIGLFIGLFYSLSVNMLSMFESTMCMKFAGGEGC